MCPYHRFTTFCQLKTKLDKCKSECSVIAMKIFCYLVCVTYCFFYLAKPKTKKSYVIVLKFMIQRLFENSCQNLKHASSWVREESLECYSYFYPQFPLVNNKTVSLKSITIVNRSSCVSPQLNFSGLINYYNFFMSNMNLLCGLDSRIVW